MSGAAPERSAARRTFRRHFAAWLVVNAVLTAINVAQGAPWWSFWPMVVWGLPLTVHFLWYRANEVDEAWVEERTLDLRTKSYDMSHIDDIRKAPLPPGAKTGERERN